MTTPELQTIQLPTTHHRPLLLVDIDGVLNAFGARRLSTHQRVAVAGRYQVVLDDRHPGWFDVLGGYAELRWATMWQSDAGRVFGRVAGLGTDWDHLDFDSAWATGSVQRTGHGVGGYKWPMIEPLGAGDRPLIWLDDDMTDGQLAWAQARDASGRPTLFVRPDPANGFTPEQYVEVLAFVREHGAMCSPTVDQTEGVFDPFATLGTMHETQALELSDRNAA